MIFDGGSHSDDRRFLFGYEMDFMRGKTSDDRAIDIVVYLQDLAFDKYYKRFTRHGFLTNDAEDYTIVRSCLLSEFAKKEDEYEITRKAIDARLDHYRLGESIVEIDDRYSRAGFNGKSKFGLLRKDVLEHGELARSTILKRPTSYNTLHDAVRAQVRDRKVFDAAAIFSNTPESGKEAAVHKEFCVHRHCTQAKSHFG